MKRNIAKKIARKGSEKGIAIVFVLGIMGLLMVIGLGFAASSMLDSKIAANSVNTGNAKMFARSAFERAFILLRKGAEVEKIISRPTTGAVFDFDHLWRLDTLTDAKIELVNLSGYSNADTEPAWQYIKDPSGSLIGRFAYMCVDAGGKLDPSIHFGSLPAKDSSLPANRLFRFGIYEGEIDFQDSMDLTKTDAADLQSNLETYMGNIFEKVRKVTLKTEKDPQGFEYAFDFARPYRFPTMRDFIVSLKLGSSPGNGPDKYKGIQELAKVLEPTYYPSPEAFWIDLDNDGKWKKGEFFHRFNLARNDWDEEKFDDVHLLFGANKGDALPTEAVKNAKEYSVKLSNTTVDAGGTSTTTITPSGIQWLGIGGEDAAVKGKSDWTPELRRRQIAANIIQYSRKEDSKTVCDLDWSASGVAETATAASVTGGFLSKDPSYAGVGKHPLLNEASIQLGAKVAVTVPENPDVNGNYQYDWGYTFSLKLGAELIDIFGIPNKREAHVYCKGKVEFTCIDPGSGVEYPVSKEFEYGKTVDNGGTPTLEPNFLFKEGEWAANGYTSKLQDITIDAYTGTHSSGASKMDAVALDTFLNKIQIKNVKLRISRLVLKYKGGDGIFHSRDFAKLVPNDTGWTHDGTAEFAFEWLDKTAAQIDSENLELTLAIKAKDPRVNHYFQQDNDKSDWVVNTDLKDTAALTLGASNNIAPGGSKDTEKDNFADFAASGDNTPRISTAYIAQKPMRSLWELGAISRAEAFRTINLGKARPHANFSDRCGGQTLGFEFDTAGAQYELGDGNILDQVKIHVIGGTGGTDLDKFQQDRPYSYGKVNINSDTHGPLQALFQRVVRVKNNIPGLAYAYFDPVQNDSEEGEADDKVLSFCEKHADNAPDTCIACMIKNQTKVTNGAVRYMTRSCLLLPGRSKDIGVLLRGDDNYNDAAKEQIIGKTINLMTATPPERIYIVAIGQSIKEVPAGTYYVDWDRDGEISTASPTHKPSDISDVNDITHSKTKAFRKAGYIRPASLRERLTNSDSKYVYFPASSCTGADLEETITSKTKGTYKNGVDKITGTSKLIAVLDWDPVECKWKIRSMSYGE